MHLPPTVWGPFFWHTMHIVAIGYSKHPTYTDKKCAKEWKEVCPDCNKHHNTNYKKFIYLSILISVAAAGGVCALFIL